VSKNFNWNEGSPTLDTTELCARRASQPVQHSAEPVRFLPILCARLGESQTDLRAQGMEKLVKWEKGKG